jgi:hypothetical protein
MADIISAEHMDEFGEPAAPEKVTRKRKRHSRKKNPAGDSSGDDDSDFTESSGGSGSEDSDSDVEMLIPNEEVSTFVLHGMPLIAAQLAQALPSKTIPDRRHKGKGKSSRNKSQKKSRANQPASSRIDNGSSSANDALSIDVDEPPRKKFKQVCLNI